MSVREYELARIIELIHETSPDVVTIHRLLDDYLTSWFKQKLEQLADLA